MLVVKEGIRGLVQGFLFRRMPRLMVIILVALYTINLNYFLAENGTSYALSPLLIVAGGPLPDVRSHSLDFGICTKTFEYNIWFQKSSKTRSALVIALGPSLCRKPRQMIMCLDAGNRLCIKKWTEASMPKWFIDRFYFKSENNSKDGCMAVF